MLLSRLEIIGLTAGLVIWLCAIIHFYRYTRKHLPEVPGQLGNTRAKDTINDSQEIHHKETAKCFSREIKHDETPKSVNREIKQKEAGKCASREIKHNEAPKSLNREIKHKEAGKRASREIKHNEAKFGNREIKQKGAPKVVFEGPSTWQADLAANILGVSGGSRDEISVKVYADNSWITINWMGIKRLKIEVGGIWFKYRACFEFTSQPKAFYFWDGEGDKYLLTNKVKTYVDYNSGCPEIVKLSMF